MTEFERLAAKWKHPSLHILDRGVHDLALGWLRLAIIALTISGIYAVLVAIARTPLVEWIAGRNYLYIALVAHVTFALNGWLLTFIAALWVLLAGGGHTLTTIRLARSGLILASPGALFLALVPLAGVGQPILSDYVPVLEHPLFRLGLGAFFAGISLAALSFLKATLGAAGFSGVTVRALQWSAIAYLASLVSFSLSALVGGVADHAALVWRGGHLLQLVNAGALVAGWWLLNPDPQPGAQAFSRFSLWAFVVAIFFVAISYVTPLGWEPIAAPFWAALSVPVLTTWAISANALRRSAIRRGTLSARMIPLALSLSLFAVGGLVSLSGMGIDTRVTAHYHGTVGAVTMILMGVTYRILPAFGLEPAWPKLARLQPLLYGCGLLLLIAGLFWAGESGAPRKLFQSLPQDPFLLAASVILGVGALGTVVGGITFVVQTGEALLRGLANSERPSRVALASAAKVSSGDSGLPSATP